MRKLLKRFKVVLIERKFSLHGNSFSLIEINFKETRQGYTSKIKVVSLCKQGPNQFLNLTLTPKIVPKGPKSAKKAPNLTEVKTKRQGSTSKTKVD